MKILLYIFIALFLIYAFIVLYGNKFVNPYYISMYFAPPGVGKTTFLNKLSYDYTKKGWHVYSISQDVQGEFIKNIDDIYTDIWQDEKNLLIVDEASILFNNRNYKTNFNHNKLEWWKKHRHHKVKVIMASQDYEDVDKVLRKLTTKYYLLSRFANLWILSRKVKKGIYLTTPVGAESGTFADGYTYESIFAKDAIQFCYLPHWVKKFDSYAK